MSTYGQPPPQLHGAEAFPARRKDPSVSPLEWGSGLFIAFLKIDQALLRWKREEGSLGGRKLTRQSSYLHHDAGGEEGWTPASRLFLEAR